MPVDLSPLGLTTFVGRTSAAVPDPRLSCFCSSAIRSAAFFSVTTRQQVQNQLNDLGVERTFLCQSLVLMILELSAGAIHLNRLVASRVRQSNSHPLPEELKPLYFFYCKSCVFWLVKNNKCLTLGSDIFLGHNVGDIAKLREDGS
jgi:hypothetical protein